MPKELTWDSEKPDGSPLCWDDSDPAITWDALAPEAWSKHNNTMQQNMVEATLAEQAVTDIVGAIGVIRNRLNFLITLDLEERQRLPHITPQSQGTLEQAHIFANANPGALAGDFNLPAFNQDFLLQKVFLPIATAIAQLNEEVQDTLLALNSDLYYGLLDIYAFAKASNRDGRYDEVVSTLKPFFSRPRKKAAPTDSTPTPPPPPPANP